MDTRTHLEVECHAGYRGDETPRRLRFDGRVVEVEEVVDRWYEPGRRYFKLRGSDGGLYLVRHVPHADAWELVIYDSDTRDDTRLSSSSSPSTSSSRSPDSVK